MTGFASTIPGTKAKAGVREIIATTSLAAKIGIIVKSANTRVEETRGPKRKNSILLLPWQRQRPLDK